MHTLYDPRQTTSSPRDAGASGGPWKQADMNVDSVRGGAVWD